MSDTTYRGVVKFVHPSGFLFLTLPDGSGPDVFAHISEWERCGLVEPEKGDRFEFEIIQRP